MREQPSEISSERMEALVEAFVVDRSSLSPAERQTVENHLAAHPAMAEFARFLQTFYRELAEERPVPSTRLDAFVDDVLGTSLYRLDPVVDAAPASLSGAAERVPVACTLATPDRSVLLRVVEAGGEGRYLVFVGARDRSLRADALVTFPAAHTSVLTNRAGVAALVLAAAATPDEVFRAGAELRRPVAEFDLRRERFLYDPARPERTETTASHAGRRLVCRMQDGELRVLLRSSRRGPDVRTAVLSSEGHPPLQAPVEQERSRFPLKALPKSFKLRLYA